MFTPIGPRRSRRGACLSFMAALVLILSGSAGPAGHASQNLPVFTSAIDITSGRIHLKAVVPDRDTGAPIEVPLPVDLLGPKMNNVMNTALGAQMDEHWNVTPDPKTGRTPRQEACDGLKGIKVQVQDAVRKIGGGFSAYDISCNLATQGMVVAKQSGSALYISYQLLNNTVDFYVTTPATCHRDRGTFACPNDPLFSVRFASEVWTVVQTPALCQLTASGGTANLHAVQIDTHNFTGDVARNIIDTVFLGNKFTAAELAIQAAQQQVPLPLDEALKELRESAPCTDQSHPGAAVVSAFSDVETTIDLPEGVIVRLNHPPIAAPRFQNVDLASGPDTCKQGFVWREAFAGDRVCVTPETRTQTAADNTQADARREPGGGAYGPNTCKQGFVWRAARPDDFVCVTPEARSQAAADNAQASARRELGPSVPSFARPTLTVQPIVNAGSTVPVNGQLFPPTSDPTVLALRLERDTTSACNGGATELEWGPAGGEVRVERLPRTGNASSCASSYDVKSLAPGSAYQFRARDCDALTCSPWTAPLRLTTQAASAGAGQVALTMDAPGGTPLGTATVNAQGAFEVTITIPAGTAAGTHAIHAVSGDAQAQTGFQVAATSGGAATGSIMLTGSFYGDTGCPRRPLPDYAQKVNVETPFALFGSGFAQGTMTLHVDAATGQSLGESAVGGDGTFCKADFQGPPTALLGNHTLVAVQNGAVMATIPVEFTPPYRGPR